jgi:hypothetical protein
MPVTYQIDPARHLIRTKCIGPITLQEVLQHFQDLKADLSRPEWLDVLLDLDELTSLPSSAELRTVAHAVSAVRPTLEFRDCAICAPTDAIFGMLRVWEVFTEQFFRATQVFRSLEEAERWLELRPPGTSHTGPT